MELQAHLQRLAVSHQQKNRDSRKSVPVKLFVNDHAQKLEPANCIFFDPRKLYPEVILTLSRQCSPSILKVFRCFQVLNVRLKWAN